MFWFTTSVLLLGAVVLGGCGPRAAIPDPPSSAPPAATPTPSSPPAPPARLTIAKLGVDAVVEAVGVDAQGRMATPSSPDKVAWYQPGATPGQSGDAVIDGHLDSVSGPAVFWHLDQLQAGDQILIATADKTTLRFVVDATWTIDFDRPIDPLFTMSGAPTLSLITCHGSWDRGQATYSKRLIVHATQG
jgi:LPXTG-site transpeptidase (sortase) family protein